MTFPFCFTFLLAVESDFQLVTAFFLAFGVSLVLTLSIIDLVRKKQLFDTNNNLKLHIEKVGSLGGIAIFSAFWITVSIVNQGTVFSNFGYLFAGSFLLFLTGVKDDLVNMPASVRLLIQSLVSVLLFLGGLGIQHLPGTDWVLPEVVSFIFTMLLLGVIVNAYNFIDGINGLAGGLAIIAALSFALIFYLSGQQGPMILSLTLAGAASGFLVFNFGKAKIFMGDNGSTFIGVILTYLSLLLFQPETTAFWGGQKTLLIFGGVLIVPLLDMVKVILGRLLNGKSPLRGDRTHIHHLLQASGLRSSMICWLLYTWSVIVSVCVIFCLPENMYFAVPLIIVASAFPYILVAVTKALIRSKKQSRFQSLRTEQSARSV